MSIAKISFWATLVASALAAKTSRTFAVNHFYGKGPLTMGRMDPIVNPGVASAHVHAIQGGSAFALTMSDTEALTSNCTSSLVKNDKSNYWTPSLYFKDPTNGSIEAVPMFYMNVYYFFEPTNDKITAFPTGLRMVIGSAMARSPPATSGNILDLSQGTPQPVQWTCPRSSTAQPLYPVNSDGLHGAGIQDPNNKGAGVGFPDQNCDGYASPLRADVHFPSCYNPAAGLTDYKNNMQFPTNGDCPTGWIHTPHIFYEVYWNTPLFADRWTQGQGTQPFILSNGDPTGYSLHGDFLAGWDEPTLQQIIDNCDAGDSGMDKCPGLIGGLNDPSTSCNIPNLVPETISGVMDALPGNNPIGQWGVAASMAPVASGSSTKAAAASSTKATSATSAASAASPAKTSTKPNAVVDPISTAVVDTTTSVAAAATAAATTSATTSVVEAVVSPTPTASATLGSGSITWVTSIVSETTIIYTTVTASEAAPTSSPNVSIATGWSYKGCYSDVAGNRVLSGITFANLGNHEVTTSGCVDYCDSKGYAIAGTEFGGQCFCDNALATTSNVLEATSCDMPCEGDGTQTCGGSLALSIYSKTAPTKAGKRHTRHIQRHLHGVHY